MTDQPAAPSATPEWHDQDEGADAASGRVYDPSTGQVNRGREQGLGVGQIELNAQRDATGDVSTDRFGAGEESALDPSPEPGGAAARPATGSAGEADDLDPSAGGGI